MDEQNNNVKYGHDQKPVIKGTIIPKSLEPNTSKSRRLGRQSKKISSHQVDQQETRRVHSGPKERTPVLDNSTILQRSSSFGDISERDKEKTKTIGDGVVSDNISLYFEDNIRPLLKQMQLNELHSDIDSLLTNFDILWKTLEIGKLLGKSALGSKRRSELLSTVFKCVKSNNEQLQLKLCRLYLAVSISSNKYATHKCGLGFNILLNSFQGCFFLKKMLN